MSMIRCRSPPGESGGAGCQHARPAGGRADRAQGVLNHIYFLLVAGRQFELLDRHVEDAVDLVTGVVICDLGPATPPSPPRGRSESRLCLGRRCSCRGRAPLALAGFREPEQGARDRGFPAAALPDNVENARRRLLQRQASTRSAATVPAPPAPTSPKIVVKSRSARIDSLPFRAVMRALPGSTPGGDDRLRTAPRRTVGHGRGRGSPGSGSQPVISTRSRPRESPHDGPERQRVDSGAARLDHDFWRCRRGRGGHGRRGRGPRSALEETPPRILNIVGESGSGKTTVARTLLGLSKPSKGQGCSTAARTSTTSAKTRFGPTAPRSRRCSRTPMASTTPITRSTASST